jgi:hypothetical protein
MSAGDLFSDDEQFSRLLAASDEAEAGTSVACGENQKPDPPELKERLEAGLACARLLREVLPRYRSRRPHRASPDPGL